MFDSRHEFYPGIKEQAQQWQALSQEVSAVAIQALEHSCISNTQAISSWPREHSEPDYAGIVQDLRQKMAKSIPQIGYLKQLHTDAVDHKLPQQTDELDLVLMSKIRDSFFSVAPREHDIDRNFKERYYTVMDDTTLTVFEKIPQILIKL